MNTNSNLNYTQTGDYLLPNLTLNQPRKPLGKYGRLRRTYLKEQRPVLYHTMLLNGSLYPHLMEVEQTAENTAALRERLTELSAGGIVLTVTAEAYRPGPKAKI